MGPVKRALTALSALAALAATSNVWHALELISKGHSSW